MFCVLTLARTRSKRLALTTTEILQQETETHHVHTPSGLHAYLYTLTHDVLHALTLATRRQLRPPKMR